MDLLELNELQVKERHLYNKFIEAGFSILDYEKLTNRKDKAILMCEDGYKYFLNINSITDTRRKKSMKFSVSNPFTLENICLYTKENVDGFIFSNESKSYTRATDRNLQWECPNNHTFTSSWQMFQSGSRCGLCSFPNRYISEDDFLLELSSDYILLSEYTNASTMVELQHFCGHRFSILPCEFIDKNYGVNKTCKKCSGLILKTQTEFTTEVFNLTGDEYTVLSKYLGSKDTIKIQHNKCQHIFYPTPTNFLSRLGCPKCNKTLQRTPQEFNEEIQLLTNGEYIVIGEYENQRSLVTMKHIVCGYKWQVRPSHFILSHSRCPDCSVKQSFGASLVEKYLKKNKLDFKKEQSFPDCNNLGRLYFDFYVEGKTIIEYDGQQHFHAVEFWGGEPALKRTQQNDQIKNIYCIENEIHLLRIPYWENKSISNILSDFFEHINTKTNQPNKSQLLSTYLVDNTWSFETYIASHNT